MILRRLLVASAATFLVVVGVVAPATSAHAASGACPRGTGVTVVVNNDVRCDPGASDPARSSFQAVGHQLTDVPRQPGAVCTINGYPSSGPCFGTTSYWGLFWSDGASGTWTYASEGASSLSIPAGGWVAFVWQGSSSRTPPSMTPRGPAPAAPAPSAPGGGSGSASGSGDGGGATAGPAPSSTPTPSASPSADASTEPGTDPSAAATSSEERDDETTATSASTDDDGAGPWGIVAAVLLVAGVGGAAFVVNRRRRSGV